MNAKQIGEQLVKLCREGKNHECVDTLYAKDIVSIEAASPPGADRVTNGIEGVRKKSEWWAANHEIHRATTSDVYPHGDDRFAVRFEYDITQKPTGRRFTMDEIAVFTVKDGKIVKEEFFYPMG